MAEKYPYTISNKQIEPFFAKIRTAQKPERLTQQVLKHWGFTASNDRALPRILKYLGFLDESGAPTEQYDRLKDVDWKIALAEQIKELYSDLYATDTDIHNASDDEIKGAISRITGQDAASVNRFFNTFKALTPLAKFDSKSRESNPEQKEPPVQSPPPAIEKTKSRTNESAGRETSFHYNIQIHLPATTDISVYNAIFKSLKENLIV